MRALSSSTQPTPRSAYADYSWTAGERLPCSFTRALASKQSSLCASEVAVSFRVQAHGCHGPPSQGGSQSSGGDAKKALHDFRGGRSELCKEE